MLLNCPRPYRLSGEWTCESIKIIKLRSGTGHSLIVYALGKNVFVFRTLFSGLTRLENDICAPKFIEMMAMTEW